MVSSSPLHTYVRPTSAGPYTPLVLARLPERPSSARPTISSTATFAPAPSASTPLLPHSTTPTCSQPVQVVVPEGPKSPRTRPHPRPSQPTFMNETRASVSRTAVRHHDARWLAHFGEPELHTYAIGRSPRHADMTSHALNRVEGRITIPQSPVTVSKVPSTWSLLTDVTRPVRRFSLWETESAATYIDTDTPIGAAVRSSASSPRTEIVRSRATPSAGSGCSGQGHRRPRLIRNKFEWRVSQLPQRAVVSPWGGAATCVRNHRARSRLHAQQSIA